jgi:hypothetical protein
MLAVYLTALSAKSDYTTTVSNDWMLIMNYAGYGRKLQGPNLMCYPGIPLEGLRKIMKTFELEPPEYKPVTLQLYPPCV